MPCNCMPGKSVDIPMTDLMANAKMTDSSYNLEFLRRGMASAIVSVHDEIRRRKLEDTEEDMEFLRHIRNEGSDGNRFTFRDSEPRRPAKLKNMEITRSSEGMSPVLFDFITPGDAVVLNLLDCTTSGPKGRGSILTASAVSMLAAVSLVSQRGWLASFVRRLFRG